MTSKTRLSGRRAWSNRQSEGQVTYWTIVRAVILALVFYEALRYLWVSVWEMMKLA